MLLLGRGGGGRGITPRYCKGGDDNALVVTEYSVYKRFCEKPALPSEDVRGLSPLVSPLFRFSKQKKRLS